MDSSSSIDALGISIGSSQGLSQKNSLYAELYEDHNKLDTFKQSEEMNEFDEKEKRDLRTRFKVECENVKSEFKSNYFEKNMVKKALT